MTFPVYLSLRLRNPIRQKDAVRQAEEVENRVRVGAVVDGKVGMTDE